MECKRCGNQDISYFYLGSKGYYCRKCVTFKRILIEEDLKPLNYQIENENSDYEFSYELTSYQLEASRRTLEYLKEDKNVLLKCVTGAGKTDIVALSISYYLKKGLRVAYAIPRREVVIELTGRFKKVFNQARVVSVYGGHHDELTGDLIICTTHQLYRYYQSFDLLILDEADAFPLSGNDTLMNIALKSCRGQFVFSTATVNDFLNLYLKKMECEEVNLYVRPSLKPMYIPKVLYMPNLFIYLSLIFLLRKCPEQGIIFVSSKKMAVLVYRLLKPFFSVCYVYSDYEKRDENILKFRNGVYRYAISTTVLERGISLNRISVYILYDHPDAFDTSSLVQIVGRVRRGLNSETGEAYIISSVFSKDIRGCINQLKEANRKYEVSVL